MLLLNETEIELFCNKHSRGTRHGNKRGQYEEVFHVHHEKGLRICNVVALFSFQEPRESSECVASLSLWNLGQFKKNNTMNSKYLLKINHHWGFQLDNDPNIQYVKTQKQSDLPDRNVLSSMIYFTSRSKFIWKKHKTKHTHTRSPQHRTQGALNELKKLKREKVKELFLFTLTL